MHKSLRLVGLFLESTSMNRVLNKRRDKLVKLKRELKQLVLEKLQKVSISEKLREGLSILSIKDLVREKGLSIKNAEWELETNIKEEM